MSEHRMSELRRIPVLLRPFCGFFGATFLGLGVYLGLQIFGGAFSWPDAFVISSAILFGAGLLVSAIRGEWSWIVFISA